MKTAISVPDDTFERASRQAKELGMSRSDFFATAAQHYLAILDQGALTAAIDAAVDASDNDDAAVTAGKARLAKDAW